MIVVIVLLIINILFLCQPLNLKNCGSSRNVTKILRNNLEGTEFQKLTRCIPITAHHTLRGTVGYNLNKGGEIGLCLDGEVNEIFHVLIHELAHCMVQEYDHSTDYWGRYVKLRDICVRLNIYEPIPNETPFCGMHIQDK